MFYDYLINNDIKKPTKNNNDSCLFSYFRLLNIQHKFVKSTNVKKY